MGMCVSLVSTPNDSRPRVVRFLGSPALFEVVDEAGDAMRLAELQDPLDGRLVELRVAEHVTRTRDGFDDVVVIHARSHAASEAEAAREREAAAQEAEEFAGRQRMRRTLAALAAARGARRSRR